MRASVAGLSALALALAGSLGLSACSSGGSSGGGSTTTFSLPTGSSSSGGGFGQPQGPPTGKIRVANFYAPNGSPGPAIDLYDAPQPGSGAKPLISDLAYGQLSSYVSPRAATTGSGGSSNLYIFPTGSQKTGVTIDGMTSGGNISNAGWTASQQVTYVIGTNASGASGNPNAAFQEIDETWGSQQTPTFVAAHSGQGVVAVNVFGLPQTSGPNPYLQIDGSCPSDVDTTSGQPVSAGEPAQLGSANNFLLPTGSHTMAVVLSAGAGDGLSASQCASAAPVASTTVSVSGSGPMLLLVYGTSLQGVKLLSASVG